MKLKTYREYITEIPQEMKDFMSVEELHRFISMRGISDIKNLFYEKSAGLINIHCNNNPYRHIHFFIDDFYDKYKNYLLYEEDTCFSEIEEFFNLILKSFEEYHNQIEKEQARKIELNKIKKCNCAYCREERDTQNYLMPLYYNFDRNDGRSCKTSIQQENIRLCQECAKKLIKTANNGVMSSTTEIY